MSKIIKIVKKNAITLNAIFDLKFIQIKDLIIVMTNTRVYVVM